MTDYGYYYSDAGDCFGIDGVFILKSENVCDWLSEKFELYAAGVKMIYPACMQSLANKQHFYDNMVTCYPVADDGSIIKDRSIMREIWLSYEVGDD